MHALKSPFSHGAQRAVRVRMFSASFSSSSASFAEASKRKNVPLKMLVIDGYAKEGREDLVKGGASTAGDLYRKMFDFASPVGAVSDIVYPADTDFALPDLTKYDGIGWTGCSLTIYSGEDRVTKQMEICKKFFDMGIPQFGSCWAAQMAAAVAGGKVVKNLHPAGREMFVARKIELNDAGRAHPMYEGKNTVFDAWISHDDEIVKLPSNAQSLCSNPWTGIQACDVKFSNGRFWAVQYHPEYDIFEMARLMHCRIEKMTRLGFFAKPEDGHQMVKDLTDLHHNPNRKVHFFVHRSCTPGKKYISFFNFFVVVGSSFTFQCVLPFTYFSFTPCVLCEGPLVAIWP